MSHLFSAIDQDVIEQPYAPARKPGPRTNKGIALVSQFA